MNPPAIDSQQIQSGSFSNAAVGHLSGTNLSLTRF
jgi:hypothetical protein